MRLIRANIRGSIRNEIVTDSFASVATATDVSINRTPTLFSLQKVASASSLSKSGTSSQLVICGILLRQRLIQLFLIKKLLLGSEKPGANHSDLTPIGPIHAKHARSACASAQVKIPGLHGEPPRIWQ